MPNGNSTHTDQRKATFYTSLLPFFEPVRKESESLLTTLGAKAKFETGNVSPHARKVIPKDDKPDSSHQKGFEIRFPRPSPNSSVFRPSGIRGALKRQRRIRRDKATKPRTKKSTRELKVVC